MNRLEFRKLWSDRINHLSLLEQSLPRDLQTLDDFRLTLGKLHEFARIAEQYRYIAPQSEIIETDVEYDTKW